MFHLSWGGVRTPCTLPLDPPPDTSLVKVSLCMEGFFFKKKKKIRACTRSLSPSPRFISTSPLLKLDGLPLKTLNNNYVTINVNRTGLSLILSVCSGSPICLSRVWLQTELDDTKSYSPLQKRESTEASLYWLHWKSKHFNQKVNGWKATQPSLRVFSGKLSK